MLDTSSPKRLTAILTAAVLLVAACGSDEPDPAASDSTTESASAPTEIAANADDSTDADASAETTDESDVDDADADDADADSDDTPDDNDTPDDEASDETDGDASSSSEPDDSSDVEASTRTVEHALGTSEVPVDPQRIVVLDSIGTLDSVVALGAEDRLAGRINLSGGDDPSWLDIDVESIPLLGTFPNMSIEEILTVDPDVVIGYQNAAELLGPTGDRVPVVAVAPTAGVTNPRWQDVLLGVGDTLGLTADAEAFIADYDARVDQVVASLPDGFAGRDVLVLLGQLGMTGFAMGPTATPAEIFERVGLQVSSSLDGQGDFVQLVDELVPDLPADVVLMFDFDAGTTDWNSVLAEMPAYAANPAIAGGVTVVDGSLWLNAGPLGQLQLLEEIVEVLAP